MNFQRKELEDEVVGSAGSFSSQVAGASQLALAVHSRPSERRYMLEVDCSRVISGSKYTFYHPIAVGDFLLCVCATTLKADPPAIAGARSQSFPSICGGVSTCITSAASTTMLKSFYVPSLSSPSAPQLAFTHTYCPSHNALSHENSVNSTPDFAKIYMVHVYEAGNMLDASKDRRFFRCPWATCSTGNKLITASELHELIFDIQRFATKRSYCSKPPM